MMITVLNAIGYFILTILFIGLTATNLPEGRWYQRMNAFTIKGWVVFVVALLLVALR